MKRTVFALIIILLLASCAANPQDKIAGRWMPENKGSMAGIPVEISNEATMFFLEKSRVVQYSDPKNGVLKGNVLFPAGQNILLTYFIKKDSLVLEINNEQTGYVRFTQSDGIWDSLNIEALKGIKTASIKFNMEMVRSQMEMIYNNTKPHKYPTDMNKLNEFLPNGIVNPYDIMKPAVTGGMEEPKWDLRKIGTVYVQFFKDGRQFNLFGFTEDGMEVVQGN